MQGHLRGDSWRVTPPGSRRFDREEALRTVASTHAQTRGDGDPRRLALRPGPDSGAIRTASPCDARCYGRLFPLLPRSGRRPRSGKSVLPRAMPGPCGITQVERSVASGLPSARD